MAEHKEQYNCTLMLEGKEIQTLLQINKTVLEFKELFSSKPAVHSYFLSSLQEVSEPTYYQSFSMNFGSKGTITLFSDNYLEIYRIISNILSSMKKTNNDTPTKALSGEDIATPFLKSKRQAVFYSPNSKNAHDTETSSEQSALPPLPVMGLGRSRSRGSSSSTSRKALIQAPSHKEIQSPFSPTRLTQTETDEDSSIATTSSISTDESLYLKFDVETPKLLKRGREQNLFVSKSKTSKKELFQKLKTNAVIDTNEEKRIRDTLKDPSFRSVLNAFDEASDQTLLSLACSIGHVLFVDMLLKTDGINVNDVQDKLSDSTPLHVATWGGHVEVVAMLLARGAIPQFAGINSLLPEKEIENNPGMDKDRKKRMEELWRAYNRKKKGIEKFLPDGKNLAYYKPSDPQMPLETIILGLTSDDSEAIKALYFETGLNNSGGFDDKNRVTIMDFLLTQRLYCSPEDCFSLLKKRYTETDEKEGELEVKVKVLNIFKYWITKLWQEFQEKTLYSKVEVFLHSVVDNTRLVEPKSIAKKLLGSLKEVSMKTLPEVIVPEKFLPRNKKVSITSFYANSIVQHLNAIDANLWKQVRPTESWEISKLQLLLKWEKRLNRLVTTEIMAGQSISQRVDSLTRFMDICDELTSNKDNFTNFNSLLAILDALCSFCSTVLWKGVPLDKKNKFDEYTKLFERNFSYCSEKIKTKIAQKTPFIPPVAVYNFYGLRWAEKQNLKSKIRTGHTPVTLTQLRNASQFYEAVLRIHSSVKTFTTQPAVLDFLFSDVISDQEKEDSLKELTSHEYLTKEWFKAIHSNDTHSAGIILAHDTSFLVLKDADGKNSVHHATEENSETMIKFLFNYDRNIEISLFEPDKNKEYPLSIASKNGFASLLSLFLSYYESWHTDLLKKTSNDKDPDSLLVRNQLRLHCKQENSASTTVWDLWIAGGSKALENSHFPVMSKNSKHKQFPWQKEATKESDIPSLDWNKFGSFQTLPPSPIANGINILISSEEQYLKDLITILKTIKPITYSLSLSPTDIDSLFNGIDSLTFFHKNLFEELLLTTIDNYFLVFDIFSDKFETMKTYYTIYSQNYGKQMKIIRKLKHASKSFKFPAHFPRVPCSYFVKPIKRISQYSGLLSRLFHQLPETESKKGYAEILKRLEDMCQGITSEICRIKSEKILSNLSASDQNKISSNNKVVYKVGKYYNPSKSRNYTYLLLKDSLCCINKKDHLIRGTRNMFIEEEYPIRSIVKVVPEKDNVIKIHLFPKGFFEFTVEDDDDRTDWIRLIMKLKENWLSENGISDLLQKIKYKIDDDTIDKYWSIYDKKKPKHWIALGDLYKQEKRLTEAINCYEKATEIQPASYKAFYKQAKIHLNNGNLKRGVYCLDQIMLIMNHTEVDIHIAVNTSKLLQMHNNTNHPKALSKKRKSEKLRKVLM